MGEADITEGFFNEPLAEPVVSLLQIHFNHHPTCLALLVLHRVNNLLGYENIIRDTLALNETCLCFANQSRYIFLEFVSNDLGDNFIRDIEQTYGSEVFYRFGTIHFRN